MGCAQSRSRNDPKDSITIDQRQQLEELSKLSHRTENAKVPLDQDPEVLATYQSLRNQIEIDESGRKYAVVNQLPNLNRPYCEVQGCEEPLWQTRLPNGEKWNPERHASRCSKHLKVAKSVPNGGFGGCVPI